MKGAAILLALAVGSAAPGATPPTDRGDAVRAVSATATEDFPAREQRRLAAASGGDRRAVHALADFYMAHELWVEALAALARIDDPTSDMQMLAAECDYRLGRYRRVVARLDHLPRKPALQAMALTKLGAFTDAREVFRTTAPINGDFELAGEYWTARAEAMIDTGDTDAAVSALAKVSASPASEARRLFLLAKLDLARGDTSRASARLRRAGEGAGEWAMRARLALADEDPSQMEALSLQWQGGAFERDLQMALGRSHLAASEFDKAFAALRIVVGRYSESDAATAAQETIGRALPRLLAADSALAPKTAARLFFENVEFAPQGRAGDALIANAATMLEALGLYQQAAQLLDHQVFKRLRGADRATVAADLAEAHLLADNPAAALTAIRATRIAGLADPVNQRRRSLEAQALAEKGETGAAVELLSSSPSADDLLLRGKINWLHRSWGPSASDYAAYLSAMPAIKSSRDRDAAVRCATAFLLAGDRAGYRAFAREAALRLEGSPEADLIRTLGDIDREAFLERFMADYRSVYGAGS